MTDRSRIPVIIGASQITDTTSAPDKASSPLDLMVSAARKAADDSGAGAALLRELDSLTVIRLFSDTIPSFKSPFGRLANAPWSVARRLGANPRDLVYPPQGGDTPQLMLARACDRIAQGGSSVAMVLGAEALRTERNAKRAALELNWGEDAPQAPNELGGASELYTRHETDHGMRSAIAMYALIEQLIRASKKRSVDAHRKAMGQLYAPFAAVAKANPFATRRKGYSAEEIGTVAPDNPTVGFPYTRLMTANAYVDQSAALIVCSEAKADELGIGREKRVYLHGHAQAHDQWFVTDRTRLDVSPAVRASVGKALELAGRKLADMSTFDIYSCFPSAVQVACKEIGLAEDDPRGLTVTGGLSFFGGPGSNYVTHSIAETVHRLRQAPNSFGLVYANGGLITKHAVGIYSAIAPARPWQIEDRDTLQGKFETVPKQPFTETPQGDAVIETYTVVHDKSGPAQGIVMGRLLANDVRFVANTPKDAATLSRLETNEALGLKGAVTSKNGRNTFIPTQGNDHA